MEANAVVQNRMEIAPGLMILQVRPEGWDIPPFKAGQYTVLGLPGSAPRDPLSDPEDPPPNPDKRIVRAYSAASAAESSEYLEFYITLVRSGALTPRLFALKPGDPIWLSPKMVGMFTLDQIPKDQNLILIATGTGLAPYMSMLRSHLQEVGTRHTTVIHGARHSWDLGYRAELETMQRLSNRFNYAPIISEPAGERVAWQGRKGFIQDYWNSGDLFEAMGYKPTPEDTHILLCGNPLMIENLVPVLISEGFTQHTRKEPGQVHLEKYW
jgi:ferredoxin--NADP+ reductase